MVNFVEGKAYAKVKTLAGPPSYFKMIFSAQKGKVIDWDQFTATPTDPGTYKILGSTSHYLSNTYQKNTIVPFGAQIIRNKTKWYFENKGKLFLLPEYIVEDLQSPQEKWVYNYYDAIYDQNRKLKAVRWAGHDFGKYVLKWTKDGKSMYPEIGYSAGQLLYEQTILVKDLAKILTAPGPDTLDNCITSNANFMQYKIIASFLDSKGKAELDRISPAA
jgi:hypothetical protein